MSHLLQITDLHICADPAEQLAGINSRETLLQVLDSIAASVPRSVPLLLTGDIAAHGELAAYQWLNQVLLATGREVYWLPGNHDDLAQLEAGLVDFPRCRSVHLAGWQLLLLNSSESGSAAGKLGSKELDWLRGELSQSDTSHLLLALHHPLAAVGSAWMDAMCVADSDELGALMESEARLRGVVCGHVHQQSCVDWCGVAQLSAPASCFQFAPGSDEFALDDEARPGYRLIQLHSDGRIESAVVRV